MSSKSLNDLHLARVNNFNLIRIVAALAVIYGHTAVITGQGPQDFFLQYIGYKFIGGVAVDVFFVVSGFLITGSALGRRGLIYYCFSRFLRIYPALIACVLITVFILGPALTESSQYWSNPQTLEYFLINATATGVIYTLPGVFENANDAAVNGSLWSIAVELKMYILILIFALLRIIRSRTVFNFVFFIGLVIGFLKPDTYSMFFEYANHRHVAMMFMIGAFAFLNKEDILINGPILLLLFGFAAITYGESSFGVAYALLLPYLTFYLAFAPGFQWFNRFGDYSYGVYLFGWPLQQCVYLAFPEIPNLFHTVLACMFALALSYGSWHLIEKRALSYKVPVSDKVKDLFSFDREKRRSND